MLDGLTREMFAVKFEDIARAKRKMTLEADFKSPAENWR